MDKVGKDTPKNQHYVPQFLLKNFSYGKSKDPKIFAFDKSNSKSFPTSVRKSASQNGFYNFDIDGEKHTLEHKLSKLETICGNTVKKICREGSLSEMTHDDHQVLCVFVANLLLRVKKQRAFVEQLNTGMTEWFETMGLKPGDVQNFHAMKPEDVEKLHTEFTHEKVIDIAKLFYDKPIALLKSPNGCNFIISDNPVTMHNHWPKKFRGNKGVSVPGIEVQVPISNKLCLSFVCPHLYQDLDKKLNLIINAKAQNLPMEDVDTSYAEMLLSSIKEGKAVEASKDNVTFANSLQIAESLNYIYSNKNDFKMAEEMIKEHPDLANGKVMQMGF
jgi:hypothetical protein